MNEKTANEIKYEFLEDIMKRDFSEISENVKYIVLEEIDEIDNKIPLPDFVMELGDNFTVMIELQQTIPERKRLEELLLYILNETLRNGKEVYACMLCVDSQGKEIIELRLFPDFTIPIKVLSLKEKDGDKILEDVKNKIENNEEVDIEDGTLLALIPFTSLTIPIDEAMEIGVDLANKITDECIRDGVKRYQEKVIRKIFSAEKQKKLNKKL